jgi:hypothetical protein
MRAVAEGKPIAAPQIGTVFLADTALDQEPARNEIRNDLQARRITVLPQGDLPPRGNQFEQRVRECLQKADLSIHILGKDSGYVPEGRQRPHTWLQHDLALKHAQEAPDFRRIIWLPPALDSPDDCQRQYLDSLHSDDAVLRGAEILRDKLEDLKARVIESVKQIRAKREEPSRPKPIEVPGAAKPAVPAKASNDPLTVYLICDPQDLQSPAFLALDNFLFDRGYEPLKLCPDESAEDARSKHEEFLQICDACLIYYGAASDRWVDAKLTDFLKIRSKRQAPFRSKAVYVAPPVSDAKRALRTNQAKVVQGGSEFSGEQLGPFLEPLSNS